MSELPGAYADSQAHIRSLVTTLRGQRVLLDRDLASLYGITVKQLNERVTQNLQRFPFDFAFAVTLAELEDLRLGGFCPDPAPPRTPPRVFTARGLVMAAFVLEGPLAQAASIHFARVFARLERALYSETGFPSFLRSLRASVASLDADLSALFAALETLADASEVPT